jgi:divalent metal cation (Fe/Co/Zn/Cd) transporter
VAALVVAMIVVYVSVQLGRRSVAALLDSAPPGLAAKIERAVRAVPGVLDCHRVRVRTAGPQLFVDIHVVMDGALSLEETHALSSQIEEIIAGVAPGADVMVHAEPPSEAQPRSE